MSILCLKIVLMHLCPPFLATIPLPLGNLQIRPCTLFKGLLIVRGRNYIL